MSIPVADHKIHRVQNGKHRHKAVNHPEKHLKPEMAVIKPVDPAFPPGLKKDLGVVPLPFRYPVPDRVDCVMINIEVERISYYFKAALNHVLEKLIIPGITFFKIQAAHTLKPVD